MKFKGTPKTGSNWQINVNNPNQTLIENICIIDEGWHLDEVKADAHLISSAPEMFEALILALPQLKKYSLLNNEAAHSFYSVANAISKALGEELQ